MGCLRGLHTGSRAELSYGELLSSDEVLGRISSVTESDVAAVAADVLAAPLALTVVGPVRGAESTYARMVA